MTGGMPPPAEESQEVRWKTAKGENAERLKY
jgi:hypothetical protein